MKPFLLSLVFFLLLSSCSPQATPTSPSATIELTQPTPTQEDMRKSNGGGEPRTAGYWLIWNTCAPDNKAETARANGGREAGWVLLDDLLQDPGILIAKLELTDCQDAVNLLQGNDLSGVNQPDDAAYFLASQLLTAQLNLAVGAELCQVSEIAVQQAQLLMLSVGFTGHGSYIPLTQKSDKLNTTLELIEFLSSYNSGELCR